MSGTMNFIMAINTVKLNVPFTQKEKYVIAANLTCLVADTPKGNQFICDAFQELNIDHYEMRRIIPVFTTDYYSIVCK